MSTLDGSPAVTPMFIAVIDAIAVTSRGRLIVDTADAWDGLSVQLVRVPVATQGVRLSDCGGRAAGGDRWWAREDAR